MRLRYSTFLKFSIFCKKIATITWLQIRKSLLTAAPVPSKSWDYYLECPEPKFVITINIYIYIILYFVLREPEQRNLFLELPEYTNQNQIRQFVFQIDTTGSRTRDLFITTSRPWKSIKFKINKLKINLSLIGSTRNRIPDLHTKHLYNILMIIQDTPNTTSGRNNIYHF